MIVRPNKAIVDRAVYEATAEAVGRVTCRRTAGEHMTEEVVARGTSISDTGAVGSSQEEEGE
jgi:hypothetical protein